MQNIHETDININIRIIWFIIWKVAFTLSSQYVNLCIIKLYIKEILGKLRQMLQILQYDKIFGKTNINDMF